MIKAIDHINKVQSSWQAKTISLIMIHVHSRDIEFVKVELGLSLEGEICPEAMSKGRKNVSRGKCSALMVNLFVTRTRTAMAQRSPSLESAFSFCSFYNSIFSSIAFLEICFFS